ncbi:MAG: type II secretion system protein [Candidatus Omnitrophica bacterium]|nr:type II secretion system protein [Candidatus Omnitrophota bacterium]
MVNRRAHTITEILVASVIIIFVFTSVIGAFLLTKGAYHDSIKSCNLQRDVNILLATMIRGVREQGGEIFGLRGASAMSATLPPPATPLSAWPGQNTVYFTGSDNNIRRYFLNNNSVIYDSPTQNPNQRVIYKAPDNSIIILRFSTASIDQQVVKVYISVVQQNAGRASSTGSVTTYVNLRNAPK